VSGEDRRYICGRWPRLGRRRGRLGSRAKLAERVDFGGRTAAPGPAFYVAGVYLVASGARDGGFPLVVLQVMVAPVDTVRAIGLARTGLVGVVAASCPDLADLRAHAAVSLYFEGQAAFDKQVQPAYGVTFETDAECLRGVVRPLHYQARSVSCSLGRCAFVPVWAKGREEH
jgi:hypothetical protein